MGESKNVKLLKQAEKVIRESGMPDHTGRGPRINGSKKRAPWNSRKDNPKVMANLAANRHKNDFANNPRRCKRCRRVAMKNVEHCRTHLTPEEHRYVALHHVGSHARSRPSACAGHIKNLIRRGEFPDALLQDPTWVKVWVSQHNRGNKTRRTRDEMEFMRAAKLLAFELYQAWLIREESDDWGPWSTAVRKGRELGILA